MLNSANTNETKDGVGATLGDRRLESIGNGDLNWIGKGFLEVIKQDCENPKHSENQTNGPKN